jgi:hypothetical protein
MPFSTALPRRIAAVPSGRKGGRLVKYRKWCLLAGLMSGLAGASAAQAQQAPAVEILAEYPAGNFLENLDVLPDGRVVFTSYFAKEIEVLEGGKARIFASLSAHPVSILSLDGGFLVAAHGQPFVSGPGFVETQMFLLLDKDGRETGSFKAPQARFLNGMVRNGEYEVLIADSIAGTIWRVDARSQTITPWLKDEALGRDPAVKEFRPGANGLKREGNSLIISNSSYGTLSTIDVDAAGAPSGAVKLLTRVGRIDDFLIGPAGEIVYTTHGETLMRWSRDGTTTTLLQSGCDGCTAVALVNSADGGKALIVLTTGGFSEGRKNPARVLRLPYQ